MNDIHVSKSIEELIREQGVTAGSLDEWLAGPWSDEQDGEVDGFLAMLRELDGLPRKHIEEEDAEPLTSAI